MGESERENKTHTLDLGSLSLSSFYRLPPPHFPSTEQADAYRLAGDDRQLYIMLMRFARFEKSSNSLALFQSPFFSFSSTSTFLFLPRPHLVSNSHSFLLFLLKKKRSENNSLLVETHPTAPRLRRQEAPCGVQEAARGERDYLSFFNFSCALYALSFFSIFANNSSLRLSFPLFPKLENKTKRSSATRPSRSSSASRPP